MRYGYDMQSTQNMNRQELIETRAAHGRKLLKSELELLGAHPKTLDLITTKLALTPDQHFPMLLMEHVTDFINQELVNDVSELNGFVRAFQGYANHLPIVNEDESAITTIYLMDIAGVKQYAGLKEPKDETKFLAKTHEAHTSIEQFCSEHDIDAQVEGIVHHTLDWYLRVYPDHSATRTPQRLAAMAFGLVKRFNEDFSPLPETEWSMKELAEFGGWKTSGAASGAITQVFETVLGNIQDPELLFVVPPLATPPATDNENIAEKQAEIERRITRLFGKEKTTQLCEQAQQIVWNETGNQDLELLLQLFEPHMTEKQLPEVVDVMQLLWNYFPHKSLEGRTPAEVIAEAKNLQS